MPIQPALNRIGFIRQRNLSSQSDKIVLTNLSSTDPFNADPHDSWSGYENMKKVRIFSSLFTRDDFVLIGRPKRLDIYENRLKEDSNRNLG